jgi:hypothetical protein
MWRDTIPPDVQDFSILMPFMEADARLRRRNLCDLFHAAMRENVGPSHASDVWQPSSAVVIRSEHFRSSGGRGPGVIRNDHFRATSPPGDTEC